jgi:site-specific DNA-cytosine methylase
MKQGFGVISLDISRTGTPTICEDILTWNYRQYPPNIFRIIAAGVPCTEYSTAKTTRTRALEHADQVVLRTMESIEYFHPEIWWIENPKRRNVETQALHEKYTIS